MTEVSVRRTGSRHSRLLSNRSSTQARFPLVKYRVLLACSPSANEEETATVNGFFGRHLHCIAVEQI